MCTLCHKKGRVKKGNISKIQRFYIQELCRSSFKLFLLVYEGILFRFFSLMCLSIKYFMWIRTCAGIFSELQSEKGNENVRWFKCSTYKLLTHWFVMYMENQITWTSSLATPFLSLTNYRLIIKIECNWSIKLWQVRVSSQITKSFGKTDA